MVDVERISGRIQRILDARAKTVERLDAISAVTDEIKRRAAEDKGDPEFIRLRAAAALARFALLSYTLPLKIAGFDKSLSNFQKYGQAKPPTGNPVGVEIDVPAGTFKITNHAPEG